MTFAVPTAEDGCDVHDLIADCPPLDQNSLYANLLQCTHFAKTCGLARRDAKAVGWISGYRPPEAGDVYFLWQVAVHADARGLGLPRRLLADILNRPACKGVRWIKTTITADNAASWGLFRSIAARLDAPLETGPGFDAQAHFAGRHASETLVTIGPFDRADALN